MAVARDHTELDAWILADELRTEINRLVELRPLKIRPRLVEQLLARRSRGACTKLILYLERAEPPNRA
jgi:hypothetical protein